MDCGTLHNGGPESRFRRRPGTRKGAAGRSEPRIMPGQARPGKPGAVESLTCLNRAPPMTTRRAACHRGQLRVTCAGEPVRVSTCHCFACQPHRQRVPRAGAVWRRSDRNWRANHECVRIGDSGLPVVQRFCADCGSTAWWTLDRDAGLGGAAVGAFADPGVPAPWVALHEDCRPPWTQVPALAGIEHHPEGGLQPVAAGYWDDGRSRSALPRRQPW